MINRQQMNDIADKLKAAGTIIIPLNEVMPRITSMVQSIYNNPKTRDGRTLEHIYECVKFVVIEHALVKALGGQLNPKKFDHTDISSYVIDVDIDGIKFELKVHGFNDHWWGYLNKPSKKLIARKNYIDLVLTAYTKFDYEKQHAEITFALLIQAASIDLYLKPSLQKKDEHFYNHPRAISNGACIKLFLKDVPKK